MKRPIFAEVDEIHPILDFDKDTYYVGFLLNTMVKIKEEDKLKRVLFVKTKDSLTAIDEFNKPFKKRDIVKFDLRISPCLLTNTTESEKRMLELNNTLNDNKIPLPSDDVLTLLKATFSYLKILYERYMDYSDDDLYTFMPIWTIGTYFYPIFYSYPYVYVTGLSGTGKTRNLEIEKLLAFNAIESGNMSDSSLFRLVECLRPVLLIDETDALADKKNKPVFRELLLNGYKKFGTAWRSEKKTAFSVTHTPQAFDVYGPKMMANIEGLDATLLARTIKITMWKAKSPKYSEIIEDGIIWKDARDLLYLTMFNCHKNVWDGYAKLEKMEGMMNRNWEIWKPILTIASLLGDDVFSKMKQFVVKKIEETTNILNVESPEHKLVKALHRITTEEVWYNIGDIRRAWLNEFDEGEGNWITSHSTTTSLQRLGFNCIRMYLGRKQFNITRKFVDELITRLNIKTEEIQPLTDKKIGHPVENVLTFIRSKNAPSYEEIKNYFCNLGMVEIELESILEKMKREGLIFQPHPGRYQKV